MSVDFEKAMQTKLEEFNAVKRNVHVGIKILNETKLDKLIKLTESEIRTFVLSEFFNSSKTNPDTKCADEIIDLLVNLKKQHKPLDVDTLHAFIDTCMSNSTIDDKILTSFNYNWYLEFLAVEISEMFEIEYGVMYDRTRKLVNEYLNLNYSDKLKLMQNEIIKSKTSK